MKYELGILMAENPDTEALTLLGFRLNAMQKEREELINRGIAAGMELKKLYRDLDDARKLARYYRNISCDSQEDADELPLPWE